MDKPSADVLLKVTRVSSWEKTKTHLKTLAATLPEGTEQRADFEDAAAQFIEHIEENKLHV